jgi:hypothetical protein
MCGVQTAQTGEMLMDEIRTVRGPGRDAVEVLGATYEPGKPSGENQGRWSQKLSSRNDILKYLQTGQRYFYGSEGFGSEKRKTPA